MQDRSLSVFLDGAPFAEGVRFRLRGRNTLSLYPDPFLLDFRNLSDPAVQALSRGRELSVRRKDRILARGELSSVRSQTFPEGRVTTVAFSPGLSFWASWVSLSVPAGVTVSDTVRLLLAACSFPVPLVSFSGADPVFSRAQAFHGRTADAVSSVLSSAGARAYPVPAGIVVLPSGAAYTETALDLDNVSGPWTLLEETVLA